MRGKRLAGRAVGFARGLPPYKVSNKMIRPPLLSLYMGPNLSLILEQCNPRHTILARSHLVRVMLICRI